MYVVNHRGLFFTITGLLLAIAIGAIVVFGLPLSIDFTGGSLIQVTYTTPRPNPTVLQKDLAPLALGEISLIPTGTNDITLRTRTLTPAEHTQVLSALSENGADPLTEDQYTTVGSTLGSQLESNSLWALLAVIAAIVIYIAWAFRKVSRPVPGWGYGLTVIAMLAIDIIVPTGFYAIYCHYTGAQVDTLFVIALLALLGYCVNDVIVIFDRVREHLNHNLREHVAEPFEVTVGKSITQTLGRSINTALTVALALLSLIFIGSPTTQNFAIVMLFGVVIGTFSSITRSAPLLIPLAKAFDKEPTSKGKKK